MQSRQTTDVVLQALHMAVWRRKPKQRVLIHSDQGSQFTSMDWAAFIRAHNLEHSMSRRGNCHVGRFTDVPEHAPSSPPEIRGNALPQW
jgi:putative transposase